MKNWLALASLIAGGSAQAYEVIDPVTQRDLGLKLTVQGRLSGTAEQVSPIPTAPGIELDPGMLALGQAAVGIIGEKRFGTRFPMILNANIEGYFYSGQLAGSNDLGGVDMPADQTDDLYLKNAFGRISFANILTIGGGFQTVTFGMGLLANSGGRSADWDADAARFSDPYLGDTNLRLLVATGPHGDAKVQVFGFRDRVEVDDGLRPGDESTQAGGGIRLGTPKAENLTLIVIQRQIDAEDGDSTTANAMIVSGKLPIPVGSRTLTLEGELAYIEGESELAPSVDHPTQRLQQLGAALRARMHAGKVGFVIDALYASGDQNLADGKNTAFKVDRNYEMGLLLFRYVTAAQSGFAPVTASDPNLIGVPPEDIDRFPTRGGVSNTISFFPRAYFRPWQTVEFYGGPLIAFSEVPLVDPLNTNFGGGDPRNAFNGVPESFLGAEIDLGVRAQWDRDSFQIRGGLEGGILFPGGAFKDADGITPDPIMGARATAEVAF